MSVASQAQTIDELTAKASRALGRKRYFEAERIANRALDLARDECYFDRIARIVPLLNQARRQRLHRALDVERITIVDEPFDEGMKIEPGCYLVQPPLVGADARRLRLQALSRGIPVAVVCREPLARIGLCPIVAISGNATVRIKIDPPADPEHPDMEWFIEAMLALGNWAIESIDPELDSEKRIDALLTRLDAVPEHEGLHECLEQACEDAHEATLVAKSTPPATEAKP